MSFPDKVRLVITGEGNDPRVAINGELVPRLTRFQVIGDAPYQPTRVILEIEPDELDIDIEAAVEQR